VRGGHQQQQQQQQQPPPPQLQRFASTETVASYYEPADEVSYASGSPQHHKQHHKQHHEHEQHRDQHGGGFARGIDLDAPDEPHEHSQPGPTRFPRPGEVSVSASGRRALQVRNLPPIQQLRQQSSTSSHSGCNGCILYLHMA